MKYYACDNCGNLVEVIRDSAIIPLCCGTSMRIVLPNNNDSASIEKHVPVMEKVGNTIKVRVGEKMHPSIPDHYIEWIELETKSDVYRHYLKPGDMPEATFTLSSDNDEVINIYACCNIHGLWCLNR